MKKDTKITGFKVPQNYFEGFETQLFSKIEEMELPKSAGFKVPKNYFENFEVRALPSEIKQQKPGKVISLFSKKYVGYAAAIAACLLIGITVFTNRTENSNIDALQIATIDSYIEDGNLNIDLYDVTTFINDDDITDVNFETQKFSETMLKNYLLENMDEETLIDEQ